MLRKILLLPLLLLISSELVAQQSHISQDWAPHGIGEGLTDDPNLNEKIETLFIGAGTHETDPDSRHVQLHEQFEELGIEHVY